MLTTIEESLINKENKHYFKLIYKNNDVMYKTTLILNEENKENKEKKKEYERRKEFLDAEYNKLLQLRKFYKNNSRMYLITIKRMFELEKDKQILKDEEDLQKNKEIKNSNQVKIEVFTNINGWVFHSLENLIDKDLIVLVKNPSLNKKIIVKKLKKNIKKLFVKNNFFLF